jgi:hypothetical protein
MVKRSNAAVLTVEIGKICTSESGVGRQRGAESFLPLFPCGGNKTAEQQFTSMSVTPRMNRILSYFEGTTSSWNATRGSVSTDY